MKHAQTMGLLEKTHVSVKIHQKQQQENLGTTGINISLWQSLITTPYTLIHSFVNPHESSMIGDLQYLDYKIGYNLYTKYQPQVDVAEEIQKRMKNLLDQTKKNIMQSYLSYKAYHDRKAKAAPLETTDYCYIHNPKADTQATRNFSENSDGVDHIE